MHAFGIGIGQERKVKRSKLGWRTGFSMTFMRNGFFYRGVDICIKSIYAYICVEGQPELVNTKMSRFFVEMIII
jgi:hypothetical protein